MLDNFVDSREEMEAILRENPYGFLGMALDSRPYVVPLNHAYVDGRILLHCALAGKKLGYLRSNPSVCYTVARQPGADVRRHEEGDPCHMDCESVICYGIARVVEDLAERQAVLNAYNRHFCPDAAEISSSAVEGCAAIEITVEEMTGRREHNRELTCWRYRFADTP